MNHALKKFDDLQRSDVVIIGDNMDTGIISLLSSSYILFCFALFVLF